MAQKELSFLALARKPDLDQETAFTICRMIDWVGSQLKDDWDWDWLRKRRKHYHELNDPSLLKEAWARLLEQDFLSLQTSSRERKVSTVLPLEGLANLKTLVLQNNRVRDLRPLSGMGRLKHLNCLDNEIAELDALRPLRHLRELVLGENPLRSLKPLEDLPKLRELRLSTNQVRAFAKCERFPRLLSLEIYGEAAVSNFQRWPEMPALKKLNVHKVKDLHAIDRFKSLETLELSDGKFSNLSLLRELKALTHVVLRGSKPLDAAPLGGLYGLRRILIHAPRVEGLRALAGLPALHEIDLGESAHNARELKAIRDDLTPWDAEFKSDKKRVTPSLRIELVDQDTFDHYDSKAPFGVKDDECNSGMLISERLWLIAQIREALSIDYEEETDFVLPLTPGRQRSERLIVYSPEAYEAFREVALVLQRILSQTRNDWIIWFQSLLYEGPLEVPEEMDDFIVWIYPDRIVTTKEYGSTVRNLIEWNQ